jgi:hypothetical protein
MLTAVFLAVAICAPGVEITAGPNPQDGPWLDANTTYAIAGFAAGKKNYLVYEATASGEFTLYVGGAYASVRFMDKQPKTERPATERCMRTVQTFELVQGERYEIELGPIPPNQRLTLFLRSPPDEDRVAYRLPYRLIEAGVAVGAGLFAAVRFCVPSTYSTASPHARLSYAISESRSENTSGHSSRQRRSSSAPAPDLHET